MWRLSNQFPAELGYPWTWFPFDSELPPFRLRLWKNLDSLRFWTNLISLRFWTNLVSSSILDEFNFSLIEDELGFLFDCGRTWYRLDCGWTWFPFDSGWTWFPLGGWIWSIFSANQLMLVIYGCVCVSWFMSWKLKWRIFDVQVLSDSTSPNQIHCLILEIRKYVWITIYVPFDCGT